MDAAQRRKKVLEEAWMGDAVLSLYARGRILRETRAVDSGQLERMTSNRFLAAFGDPSEVEAEVGRVYASEGLQAAFGFIEERLMPLFDKREAKRISGSKSRNGGAA